jgi:hypothetical protein
MPEFKERQEARAAEKRRELAPYIAAARSRSQSRIRFSGTVDPASIAVLT